MATEHRICRVSELLPGARKLVELAGWAIGVFDVGGGFYALRNVCPRQFAPLTRGSAADRGKASSRRRASRGSRLR